MSTSAPFWDSHAATLADAKKVVYSLDDYEAGVESCLREIRSVVDEVPAGGSVLDFGCGIGRLICPLAEEFPEVRFIGVDHSHLMLYHAEGIRRAAGVDNVEFLLGSRRRITQLPPLDGAYSFTVLQHNSPELQQAYIQAIAGALKPKAWFRFQWIAIGGEGDKGPLSHPVDLKTMVRWIDSAGLLVESVNPHKNIPVSLWMTARKP